MSDQRTEEDFVGLLQRLTGEESSPIGDDCAVLSEVSPTLLATVDCMASSVHFTPDATTGQLAEKLIGINLSDIAAMGGEPLWALLTMVDQRTYEARKKLTEAIINRLDQRGVELAGGDISSSASRREETFGLTLLGKPAGDHLLRRGAAQPGDRLVVSGTLGAVRAILSTNRDDPDYRDTLYSAPDRLDLSSAAVDAGVRCAIDLSDGLVKDIGRVCRASGVGAVLDHRSIPVDDTARTLADDETQATEWALDGGEDFELLLAVPPDRLDSLDSQVKLTVIGHCTEEDGLRWDPPLPDSIDTAGLGYDHFSES